MDFEKAELVKSPIFAGLIGSIVSLKWAPGNSWLERLFNAICAFTITVFLSPAIAQYLKLTSQEMHSAVSFFTGLLGLNLVATGVRWLATLQLGDLLPWRNKKD